jgi:hypothetical protein
VQAFLTGAVDVAARVSYLARWFEKAGIRAEAPYLNPSSQRDYSSLVFDGATLEK